jgi:NADPH-dependent ferric siderophore reductase
MGFGPSIRQAADESQPLALRYTALRHALTYSHLGFHAAWAFAETRFGIRAGEQISSSTLKRAAEFFLAERKAWVAFERARVSYIRTCRRLGLPAPHISVEHYWSKKNPSHSVAKP